MTHGPGPADANWYVQKYLTKDFRYYMRQWAVDSDGNDVNHQSARISIDVQFSGRGYGDKCSDGDLLGTCAESGCRDAAHFRSDGCVPTPSMSPVPTHSKSPLPTQSKGPSPTPSKSPVATPSNSPLAAPLNSPLATPSVSQSISSPPSTSATFRLTTDALPPKGYRLFRLLLFVFVSMY
jgi:hypothetical protein